MGERAVLLFCVAHEGIEDVSPAAHLDPAYAATLREAAARGVEVLARRCEFLREGACRWRCAWATPCRSHSAAR